MKLEILTPQKRITDADNVDEIYFPGDIGIVGVLPDHAPMVSLVGTGIVTYTQGNVSGFVKVSGGFADISNAKMTLLVEVGENAAHIDVSRAQRALERAEGRLAAKELGSIDIRRAEAAKERAMARLRAAELYAKQRESRSLDDR